MEYSRKLEYLKREEELIKEEELEAEALLNPSSPTLQVPQPVPVFVCLAYRFASDVAAGVKCVVAVLYLCRGSLVATLNPPARECLAALLLHNLSAC